MDVELTKESRRVLKSIYDIYCERRKAGKSKPLAVQFEAPINISGLSDAKQELKNAELIKCDVIGDIKLTDKAIIFMENFTKDTILKWLEFGSKFIP